MVHINTYRRSPGAWFNCSAARFLGGVEPAEFFKFVASPLIDALPISGSLRARAMASLADLPRQHELDVERNESIRKSVPAAGCFVVALSRCACYSIKLLFAYMYLRVKAYNFAFLATSSSMRASTVVTLGAASKSMQSLRYCTALRTTCSKRCSWRLRVSELDGARAPWIKKTQTCFLMFRVFNVSDMFFEQQKNTKVKHTGEKKRRKDRCLCFCAMPSSPL
jgi:hypothetical protein